VNKPKADNRLVNAGRTRSISECDSPLAPNIHLIAHFKPYQDGRPLFLGRPAAGPFGS